MEFVVITAEKFDERKNLQTAYKTEIGEDADAALLIQHNATKFNRRRMELLRMIGRNEKLALV